LRNGRKIFLWARFDRIRGSAASRSDAHRLSCGTAPRGPAEGAPCFVAGPPMTIQSPELSRSRVRMDSAAQILRACLVSNAARASTNLPLSS
jgi:hypothetical protein